MTRRRYVQIDGELHEITNEVQPTPRVQNTDSVLWNDRAYQDLNDPRFTSRTQHREYMKRHGLTVTSDFTETWKKAERTRLERRQGIDPTRKRTIENSIRKLVNGYKPNIQKE